jgi:hypothetical protein
MCPTRRLTGTASPAADADMRISAVRISVTAPAWSCAANAGSCISCCASGLRAAAALGSLPGECAVEFGFDGVPALFAVLAPEGGTVGQDSVDLPAFAAGGAGDPELSCLA